MFDYDADAGEAGLADGALAEASSEKRTSFDAALRPRGGVATAPASASRPGSGPGRVGNVRWRAFRAFERSLKAALLPLATPRSYLTVPLRKSSWRQGWHRKWA